jgi:hypothetical protein
MCIGDTSARSSASGVPFIETAEGLQSQHNWWFGDIDSVFTRPQSTHLLCGLRTVGSSSMRLLASDPYNSRQYQARSPMAAKLHTIAIGAQ